MRAGTPTPSQCSICGKSIISIKYGSEKFATKYCSEECRKVKRKESSRKYYDAHQAEKLVSSREQYRKNKSDPIYQQQSKNRFQKWYANNREQQLVNTYADYERHKDRWRSRTAVRTLLKRGSVKMEDTCKGCGGTKNLFCRIEVFVNKKKEIEKAIKDGQIYWLCSACRKKQGLRSS